MASHRRGPWSQGEDAYLIQLVHTQGALNWVRIAQLIGSRSPKQCRERYHQNLKPSLNHEPISPEEGLQIERMVAEMGKRWAEIARRLHGRSDNAVKNWWNGSMNRRRRLGVRRRGSSQGPHDVDERPEGFSFARPSATVPRPLNTTLSSFPAYNHRLHPTLLSPATSEVSRTDSTDGAPSLMSDAGSTFSVSPIVASSSGLDLPPLHSYHSSGMDSRRSSLAFFSLSPTSHSPTKYHYSSDAETHHGLQYAPRYSVDHSHISWGSHFSAESQRPDQHRRPSDFWSQHQGHSQGPSQTTSQATSQATSPTTPVYLPPILARRQSTEEEKREERRDSRMHLSSLLA